MRGVVRSCGGEVSTGSFEGGVRGEGGGGWGPEHVHPLLGTGGDGIYSGGSARLGQTHSEVVFVGSGGHDMGEGGRRGGGGGGEKRGEGGEKEERRKRDRRRQKKTQDRPPPERDVVNPPPPQSGDDRINGRADR